MNKYLLVVFAAIAACNASAITTRQGSFNRYFLYTRENSRNPIPITPFNYFSYNASTAVLIHGQKGSLETTFNTVVKDALLTSEAVNVIVVDWSVYASQSYSNAVTAVPSVGAHLASFLRDLVTAGAVQYHRLHIIGFDLGAHIAGFTGRALNGRVARITGLNPSGSQWGSRSQRLRSSDAIYVEVIHTDGGHLLANGVGDPLGHVDFIVNGGQNQPGCLLNNMCSHNRSWELFAASLTHNHLAGNLCRTWLQMSMNNCRGYLLPMGNNNFNKYGSGLYRANTRRSYPF